MFLILLFLWIIFNGRITMEIVVFGVCIAAAVEFFMYRFMEYTPKVTIYVCKNILQILRYLAVLVAEIAKANLQVIRLIFSVDLEVEPQIIKVRTKLKTDVAKTVLANSITLTPGTITVSLDEDELTVLCLDKDFSEGMEDSVFVNLLEKLEG